MNGLESLEFGNKEILTVIFNILYFAHGINDIMLIYKLQIWGGFHDKITIRGLPNMGGGVGL